MNKIEIAKGLYRQNVYNVNLGNGHYNHITCYFDDNKKIIALFKAGDNLNMTVFVENTEIMPLALPTEKVEMIREILLSWTYDHISSIKLYEHNPLWDGIFEITPRDKYVMSHLIN
jgi:hypothetical protein